jgi:hypothetical protein
MRAKRFSLSELFLTITLLSVGFGCAAASISEHIGHEMWYHVALSQALWLGAGALIGTAVFALFNRAEIGAVVGMSVQVILYYIYFVPIGRLF